MMAMKHSKFAAFILTHGRSKNCLTIGTLRRDGYTGDIYLILDDEDKEINQYKQKYKDEVKDFIVFNKKEISKYFDIGDNLDNDKVVVYARNVCHKIAKELGLTYFLELDDDYTSFGKRYEFRGKLRNNKIKDIDNIFDIYLDFLDTDNRIKAICFSQGGEFMGGLASNLFKNKIKRKCMNCYFCRTDRPFKFYGRINEDTNTYSLLSQTGNIFITPYNIDVTQYETQQNKGGLTEFYLDTGTYYKSFFSVMMSPSCVKINQIGIKNPRIHHFVEWEKCAPKIISDKYKIK